MEKQTAVEWLEKAYWDNKGTLSQKHFDQAKQMEKEQIVDDWLNGMKGEMIAPLSINNYKPDAEEYYNETYGETKN